MSQGIFGVVDFRRGLEDPEGLAGILGGFLRRGGSNGGAVSTGKGRHFLLAMKRSPNGSPRRQTKVGVNRTQGIAAAIHGEIHNCGEIHEEGLSGGKDSHGDIDTVLHLYGKEGRGFARKLNGLFNIALVDEKGSTFYIMNDRFGMAHQVYWIVREGRLTFATHLKTLLLLPEVRREVDPESMNLFLKYAYIPSPRSIFRGIRKLPPGHRLTFREGEVRTEPYWDFPGGGGEAMDPEEAVENYRGLLEKSVSRRLEGRSEAGVLLSGGLDSSANVAMAARCSGTKVKTFSVGFENKMLDERPYARLVSERFGTEHHECSVTCSEIQHLPALVWNLEEPYFEFGLFLTWRGMEAARKETDVVIGGEGADQLFGTGGFAGGRPAALHYLLVKNRLVNTGRIAGRFLRGPHFYEKDNAAFKLRLLWKRAVDLNDWYFYGYDENELQALHGDPARASVPRIFSEGMADGGSSFADLYLDTQINQDLKHYVNENVMVKSGRMADMLDLTLRESYLDTDVTDFLVALDFGLKRGGTLLDHLRGRFTSKLLHRRAMEGLLPEEIMNKPKQGGFVPVMIFLEDRTLRERIYRKLLASPMIGEYFRVDYLRSLFRKYEEMQGRPVRWPNYHNSKANRILFLLTLDIWHSLFMENGLDDKSLPSLDEYLDADGR
ncbi:asparagine synthetase B family protein [Candidatus Moduliflexota bacterium]